MPEGSRSSPSARQASPSYWLRTTVCGSSLIGTNAKKFAGQPGAPPVSDHGVMNLRNPLHVIDKSVTHLTAQPLRVSRHERMPFVVAVFPELLALPQKCRYPRTHAASGPLAGHWSSMYS